MNGARLHQKENSSDSKIGMKKNLRIRAGWCKRQGTKSVPNNLTNQYLWDLDCGLRKACSPARKRKGMKGNATRCVNYRLLLQIDVRRKKNLRICAGWCNSCAQPEVDFTYQYLWDHHFSNLKPNATSGQSQQRFAKCNQRFVISFFVLLIRVSLTFPAQKTPHPLNQRAFSVTLTECKRLPTKVFSWRP